MRPYPMKSPVATGRGRILVDANMHHAAHRGSVQRCQNRAIRWVRRRRLGRDPGEGAIPEHAGARRVEQRFTKLLPVEVAPL